MKSSKKRNILVAVLSMAILTLFLSLKPVDFKTSKSLDIFFSFFRELSMFYVDDIDPEKTIYTGIDAILQSLDPYNDFIPEENKDVLEFQTTGEYGGMGALIRQGPQSTIIAEVYENSPAHKGGLMSGDEIIQINGVLTKGLPVDKVSEMLKGPTKTSLNLRVKRYGVRDTLTFQFNRDKIHIPSVPYYGMLENQTGYIRLSNFTNNCSKEVRKAVKELKKNGAESLILDLRGNPGGLLYEAVKIVNLFVDKGQLVVYTKGKVKEYDQEYKTTSAPLDTEIPLVVIVDRISASASEIVAGALQDLDRAVIVGERTFGKGVVQVARPLSHKAQLKITASKYYIPSGRCIQAIDYAKRNEEGKISFIPDSLISEFKTRNGRAVFDGGGVTPDMDEKLEPYSRLSASLYAQNIIFDFATRYHHNHKSINRPNNFELTSKDFDDFKAYLDTISFKYESQTSALHKQLIKVAQAENYYASNEALFDSLQLVIDKDPFGEIDRYEKEITKLIGEEIVNRYYFQKGSVEYNVRRDEVVNRCIEILGSPELIQQTLEGKKEEV